MHAAILAPAAVLVLWTMVMLGWLAFARLPALAKLGGLGQARPGGRGQDLEGVLPPQINWKSHNYTHLTEQPVLFYAVVMILAEMGPTRPDVVLAWGYVAVRIVHSLWQALVNRVPVRFALFSLGSALLLALAIRAAASTFAAIGS